MKFGQLIEYKKKIFFFFKNAENEVGRLVPDLFFKNAFSWGRSKWSAVYFQSISIAVNLAYNKNELHETLDCWFRDMLNFDFLEKGLGIVYQQHFVIDFSRNMFSWYILLKEQIPLFDYLYPSKYCAIYVLQLFVSQAVMT